MANFDPKNDNSRADAQGVILYGKRNQDDKPVYPLLIDSSNRLVISPTGGDKSAATCGSVTIGSVSTLALSARTDRVQMILCNDSTEPIYLTYGNTATLNSGIRLNANGGIIVDDVYVGAVSAICTSGGKNLTVTEI